MKQSMNGVPSFLGKNSEKETSVVAVSWTEGMPTSSSSSQGEKDERELPAPDEFMKRFRDAASESLYNAYA